MADEAQDKRQQSEYTGPATDMSKHYEDWDGINRNLPCPNRLLSTTIILDSLIDVDGLSTRRDWAEMHGMMRVKIDAEPAEGMRTATSRDVINEHQRVIGHFE